MRDRAAAIERMEGQVLQQKLKERLTVRCEYGYSTLFRATPYRNIQKQHTQITCKKRQLLAYHEQREIALILTKSGHGWGGNAGSVRHSWEKQANSPSRDICIQR